MIKYLQEIRYCVLAVFADTSRMEKYEGWLDHVFEPRALEAVSLALEKADRMKIRGVILVIDDSPTTRAILDDTLTEYRFKVVTAEDGYEGLVKAREVRPQLIFLDVLMPRMDGYEVLKRLKDDPELKLTPVVMLTSKGLISDHGAAFEKGADLYIEKPFTTKKILTIVENVLGLE
jgi:CheY-like chemotaxis protein